MFYNLVVVVGPLDIHVTYLTEVWAATYGLVCYWREANT